jgi:hypothetical protein
MFTIGRREASRLYRTYAKILNYKRKEQNQMNNKDKHLAMSRRGLNMYNPLQAERSWGYRITTTLSELRSSSIYKIEDKGEGTKGRKSERIFTDKKKICGHLFKSASSERLVNHDADKGYKRYKQNSN